MVRNHLNKIDSLNLLLQNYPNINLGSTTYPNKNHLSMYMYSVMDGLTSVFDNYDFGFIGMSDKVTLETYQVHYKKLSNPLGFEFIPPIVGIKRIAYVNFYQNNWLHALNAFYACYLTYEKDIEINRVMGICYKKLGYKKKSKYYLSVVEKLEMK